MKDLSHILKECSIKDIYYGNSGTATTYKIPIYQRNYAWERDEIFALINRVSSSMFQYLTHLFESFGSFCHPVFGQVLGSPSINVLKFNIH